MDADVVVVNHHLFLADMVVKESGFAELIPEAEVMIFDEAHQLPDIASQYFGQSLSSRQLLDLAKDITIAYRTELKDTQQLQNAPTAWRKARRISACSWETRATAAICASCWRTATFSERCCCSMTRSSYAGDVAKLSLGRSALLDAAFERATPLSRAPEAVERDQPAGLQLLV